MSLTCAYLGTTIHVNAAQMAIDSLTGPITTNEISAFEAYMATQTPGQTPWGTLGGTGHNEWADGNSGNALEALGLMYEASGDMAILNTMISWADKCTSERNDPMSAANGGQRVLWTGHINKVWVPNDPTSSSATYAGRRKWRYQSAPGLLSAGNSQKSIHLEHNFSGWKPFRLWNYLFSTRNELRHQVRRRAR